MEMEIAYLDIQIHSHLWKSPVHMWLYLIFTCKKRQSDVGHCSAIAPAKRCELHKHYEHAVW